MVVAMARHLGYIFAGAPCGILHKTFSKTGILMKRIRLSVVDFGRDHELASRLLDWVKDRYDIEIVERDADYVLHACMGWDVLKHSGVRIFMTGEDVRPDFNVCDYAFGFDRMTFGDRYCRLPYFRLRKAVYERMLQPRPPLEQVLRRKTGFCASVISNLKGDPARFRIVELLNGYKRVDNGGRMLNNIGGPVANKYEFQSHYKFAVAFESASTPGYATEKIADAFVSNAIPIYWGDPEISKDFNPDAFVNCHDFDSLEAVVTRVRQIDNDDELYRKMIAAPCFRDSREPDCLRDEYFRAFLANIFDQPHEQAFRRSRGSWSRKHERRLREAFFQPHRHALRSLRGLVRKLRQPPIGTFTWQPYPENLVRDVNYDTGDKK
jgi:hypothetical protein